MKNSKFVDSDGLSVMWTIVRDKLGQKADVSSLKSLSNKVNSIQYQMSPTAVPTWKTGYVHGYDYETTIKQDNITLYSQLYQAIDNYKIHLRVSNGYKAIFIWYNSDNSWSKNGSWVEQSEVDVVPQTPKFCVEIRRIDGGNIVANEGNTAVTFYLVPIDTQSDDVCYVSTQGDDMNSGLSRKTPFATIQRAVDSGFKHILVKEGIYQNNLTLREKRGIIIELDRYYDNFSAGTDEDNPKIILEGDNSYSRGIEIRDCYDCKFSNIEVRNMVNYGMYILNSSNLTFKDCCAHDIGLTAELAQNVAVNGIALVSSDADFYNCQTYNIRTTISGAETPQGGVIHSDGFNMHKTGTVNFKDCSAWNCIDDGISHHDACCGYIDGGEWYNCGKGGIASPTHGSQNNISNVYCHDNNYGLYITAQGSGMITPRSNILISNCVFENNKKSDLYINRDYYNVKLLNVKYDSMQ